MAKTSKHRLMMPPSQKGSHHDARPLPKKKHRVAMVSDFFYPNLGGVEHHIWSLSQRLLALGHTVIVITHSYGDRKGVRYLSGGLKVYYCPLAPLAANACIPTFTASLPLLRSILLREAITIVHAHQATSTLGSESIVHASMMEGIATVYTDHSLFGCDDIAGVILNRVLQTTLATVDAVIAVSHACRENFILRTRTMIRAPVYVIPNAVDPTRFRPRDAAEMCPEAGLEETPPRCVTNQTVRHVHEMVSGTCASSNELCFPYYICRRIRVVVISRLVYRKGVDLLVGLLPAVCQRLPHVDFVIGGSGSMALALHEMVERYGLEDRVEFYGSVPHAKVRDVLVTGDVFLNCSLTESFCMAILEAACCGLLVVSTNVGGVPEVLPPDRILLAEPNVPSLVYALVRAIQQQELTSSEATLAERWSVHHRLEDMYSWDRVARETEQVYDTIAARPRKSLSERLSCYQAIGTVAGWVACFLALTVELWHLYVQWWMPRNTIARGPDVCCHLRPQPEETR